MKKHFVIFWTLYITFFISIIAVVSHSEQMKYSNLDNKSNLIPVGVDHNIRDINNNYQNKKFTLTTSTPTATQVKEQNIIIYKSGNQARLYMKIEGTLYYINLNIAP